jgi:hypothetical protein
MNKYFNSIKETIQKNSDIIVFDNIKFESENLLGTYLIKGIIHFVNGSSLEFLEADFFSKHKYRFHYTDIKKNIIFRYDNAPHHKELSDFPFHKHLPNNKVISYKKVNLKIVLEEILEIFVK